MNKGIIYIISSILLMTATVITLYDVIGFESHRAAAVLFIMCILLPLVRKL